MGWRSPALQLKARLICDNLYNQLDEEHLLKTGKVTKVYHFRSSKNRALFRWVFGVHNNRFFTLRAVTEALRMMVKEHKLKLPEVPGLKLEAWIQKEGRSLQLLLCKARRSIAVAMDNDETQVLKDEEDDDDWGDDEAAMTDGSPGLGNAAIKDGSPGMGNAASEDGDLDDEPRLDVFTLRTLPATSDQSAVEAGEDGDAQEGEEMPDCNVYDVRDAFCILQYPRDWYQNEEDADYQDRAEDMTESFKDEDQELFQVEMSGLGLWGFCPGEYNKYKIRFWIPLTIIYIYIRTFFTYRFKRAAAHLGLDRRSRRRCRVRCRPGPVPRRELQGLQSWC
ncbi:unnamed protein product [Symbiodinium microadriaticum]|nr:unnamed protein product [Symbiodinium microadriaticum]CAE7943692.1 unnamed protein product [Symbiodinium sp. KB8]